MMGILGLPLPLSIAAYGCPSSRLPHQLRQLGDIGRDPPRASSFVSSLAARSPAELVLEINIRKLLPGAVDHDKSTLLIRRSTRAAGSGLTMKSTLAVFVALGLFAAGVQRL
jgi:hypothetical protein